MSIHIVTVFGGTGFLGRRVVRHLRKHEFSVRIASREPDRSRKLFGSDDPCLQSVEVDTRLREKAAKTRAFIRRRTIKLARRAISERATGYIADTARSPTVRQFDYLGAVMAAPRLVVEIPAQTKLWRCGYVRFPASQWRVQIWRRCPRWAHPR